VPPYEDTTFLHFQVEFCTSVVLQILLVIDSAVVIMRRTYDASIL